jgi:hypothetical protein
MDQTLVLIINVNKGIIIIWKLKYVKVIAKIKTVLHVCHKTIVYVCFVN